VPGGAASQKNESPASTSAAPGFRLSAKQRLFVQEYLVDLNACQAAIRAGYSAKTAEQQGPRLLTHPAAAAAIKEAMDARSARVEITQDMVLQRWWEIATADPNALIQFRRSACRHCHGKDRKYQWRDEEEFQRALTAAAAKEEKVLPSNEGGFGYSSRFAADPKCPKCDGDGLGQIHATDTRNLTGGAAYLYAGVKETQSGFEVKMHDQAKALENIARHLGMFKEQVEHSGGVTVEIVRLGGEG
jgi:phage terminase small subunit